MYQTEGKTIAQVIQETRVMIHKKEIQRNPASRYYYLKKYNDCTGIVTSSSDTKYYVISLFDLYGPFTSTKQANQFRRLIAINTQAHTQAMHQSWKEESDTFGALVQ